MMQLNWTKCTDNKWCNFLNVNLSHNHFDNLTGVYVIWQATEGQNTVRVGQGIIRDRITDHKNSPEIMAYCKQCEVLVTWAALHPQYLDGVEAYLAAVLEPRYPPGSGLN